MPLGYSKPLYLLPFDHRKTFAEELFKLQGALSPRDKERIRAVKRVIFQAFERALELGVPADGAAVLIDEEYGAELLIEAHVNGYTTCLTVEKSGEREFHFEYGDEFGAHVKRINPHFVKALVRYNPDDDAAMNGRQLERLRTLGAFAKKEGYKYLVELLVPPTKTQLAVAGSYSRFDADLRGSLTERAMRAFQEAGVDPDVWKLEGSPEEGVYRKIAAIARNSAARQGVGIVILGRGERKEDVELWMRAGRKVPGVIGFAVGRTIFFKPLAEHIAGRLTADDATHAIALNYKHFYDIFIGKI